MGTLQEQPQHYDSQNNNADANTHIVETKQSKKSMHPRKTRRSLADLQQHWSSSKPRSMALQERSHRLKNKTSGSTNGSNSDNPESNHDFLSAFAPRSHRQRNAYNVRALSKKQNSRYGKNNTSSSSSSNNKKRQNSELYKTQLCDTFEEYGECKYGDACQYAHGKHELREKPDMVQPSAYKTVRCKNYWSNDSICPYGNKCKFVHEEAIGFDADKLKEVKSHSKYKTEECKTYNDLGTCPYGDRCAFIHKPKLTTALSRAADPSVDIANNIGGEANLLINTGGRNLIARRRVSQEFEDDLFGLNFASKLNEEQTKDIKLKKQTDLASYIDTLATMDTETGKNGLSLYTGAPLVRQNSAELFQEHSRFHKWSQVSTPKELRH
jgi:butyrate response factor